MLRLSQRTWNNVLIFAMLLMIVLFNTSNNILNREANTGQAITLFPDSQPIVSLQFDHIKIVRIGSGWRVTPAQQQDIATLTNHWQKLIAKPAQAPDNEQRWIVVINIAGQNQATVVQLSKTQQQVYLLLQGNWYQITNSNWQTLMPFAN